MCQNTRQKQCPDVWILWCHLMPWKFYDVYNNKGIIKCMLILAVCTGKCIMEYWQTPLNINWSRLTIEGQWETIYGLHFLYIVHSKLLLNHLNIAQTIVLIWFIRVILSMNVKPYCTPKTVFIIYESISLD